jgi:hypothetical protein
MYIQDFMEDIRLSENNTHIFKDESECNTSARFTFPSLCSSIPGYRSKEEYDQLPEVAF